MVIEILVSKENEWRLGVSRHIGGFKLYLPFLFVAVNDVTPRRQRVTVWAGEYDEDKVRERFGDDCIIEVIEVTEPEERYLSPETLARLAALKAQ